ncbi:MAG: sensor histidine kinase [Gammaproteobacteria bacterium]
MTLKKLWQPVTAPALWLHHRLLPDDEWIGWTPYLWLPYLGFFFIDWSGVRHDALYWMTTAAAAAVFLVLYFRFYWVCTRERSRERYWIFAAITLLGLMFLKFNGNGQVFIIYASACCGFTGSMRKSLLLLAIILGAVLLEAALFALTPWIWAFGLFFGAMIGVANAYFGEMNRKNKVIRQSQEEIRHLATTAERERIARDLHDLLGHTLTLITVKAELAAKLAERDMPGAVREIREVERISRDALQQVREAVGGYRNGGLAGEVINARIALSAANIALSECAVTAELPAGHDALLALVLREAVTNVVRHSGAHACVIRVETADGRVRLYVEDDGRGGRTKEGNGIRGMRERLLALDGELEIQSNLTGTCLCATLPLARQSSELVAGLVTA